jgi:hypothetical protein
VSEMPPALLTLSELEWLLGKRQLSKSYERKMRAVLNRKLRTWEELERPLLEAQGFLAATISSSGIGHYTGDTVRSSRAAARVAPNWTKSKPNEAVKYERMLRPGFAPGSATRKGSILLI